MIPLFFGFSQRAFDEVKMIAQDEAAIALLQPIGRGGFRQRTNSRPG